MKNHIAINIFSQTPYLPTFWLLCYWSKCSQPIKLRDFVKCNISWRKPGIKLIFCMQININVLNKSSLLGVNCHARKYPKYKGWQIWNLIGLIYCIFLIFLMQMDLQESSELILHFSVRLFKHAQST